MARVVLDKGGKEGRCDWGWSGVDPLSQQQREKNIEVSHPKRTSSRLRDFFSSGTLYF